MPFQTISNVRIVSIGACVPKQVCKILEDPSFPDTGEAQKFIDNVGIHERRIHQPGQCASDLCQTAAEACLAETGWERSGIDLLVFVSQSYDYILPSTASVLHGKLGLGEDCAAFDISQGCSGWVYGMAAVCGMMQGGAYRKALLLVGDTKSLDSGKPLFGDAGTATLLEFDTSAPVISIDTKSAGKQYEHIIRRGGAYRHPYGPHTLDIYEDPYGSRHNMLEYEMNGPEVFVFSITKVPQAIRQMLSKMKRDAASIDAFVLHQANGMILQHIRKKCKIPAEKCPLSITHYGNTSSAAIPLTIVTGLREHLSAAAAPMEILACGFGSGLSWGTLHTTLDGIRIPELIEL